MNRRVRDLWVEALRSGRYRQATGCLTALDDEGRVTGHCCLGVLCELALLDGVELQLTDVDVATGLDRRRYDDAEGHLPAAVMRWAGLDMSNPRVRRANWHEPVTLGMLNDARRESFADLADLIEESL